MDSATDDTTGDSTGSDLAGAMAGAFDDRTPVAPHDEAAAAAMWQAFLAEHPDQAWDTPVVEHFGGSRSAADLLLGLVLAGGKRATAALVRDFADQGELLPRIGSHWIACDGAGRPRVVLRSTELRLGPADSVDDSFALDEGEGDRDRLEWLDGHARYWRRQLAALGEEWDPSMPVVFERFAVVWPPEHADRPATGSRRPTDPTGGRATG